MTTTSKDIARDVARELARRKRRRTLLVLGGLTALIVLAILYLRCGRGWGLGGPGKGEGKGEGKGSGPGVVLADAGARRCALRLDAAGITVDGQAVAAAAAVEACGRAGGADVVVVRDALQGAWDALRAALDAAHVPTFVRGTPMTTPRDAAP